MLRMKQTYGAKFNPDREYLTAPEGALFREMRESGQITLFQIEKCKREECEADVPRSKKYCSKKCMEADDESGNVD